MNKVLHNFGFGVVLKGDKPKRFDKEIIYGCRQDGFVICVEYCLPDDRDISVREMFESNERISFINVKPLKGRVMVIKR